MKLRLNDVRLRGCSFTLFPAAKELNVSEDIMHTILASIYYQLGALNKNFEKAEQLEKENPELPTVLTENALLSTCISEAVDMCLLEKNRRWIFFD